MVASLQNDRGLFPLPYLLDLISRVDVGRLKVYYIILQCGHVLQP